MQVEWLLCVDAAVGGEAFWNDGFVCEVDGYCSIVV